MSAFVSITMIGVIFCAGCVNNTPQNTQLRIAYVAKVTNESFHDGIAAGVRKAMAKLGVTVDIFPAESQQDAASQRQKLEEIAAAKNYHGVMLAPNDSEALTPFVKALDDAGIPFILIDTPLFDSPTARAFRNDCGFVGTDNQLAGTLAAQYIVGRLHGGVIFLMRGNHKHQSSIDREHGFLSIMQAHPEFQLIGRTQGWWETDAAYRAFSDYMQRTPARVAAVFAYSDPMALGVSRYYDEHVDVARPVILGVDGTLVGQRGLLEHKLDASVAQAPEVMGKTGLRNLVHCIQQGVQRTVVLSPVAVLKPLLALERVVYE